MPEEQPVIRMLPFCMMLGARVAYRLLIIQ
jgi:hypothetical protein